MRNRIARPGKKRIARSPMAGVAALHGNVFGDSLPRHTILRPGRTGGKAWEYYQEEPLRRQRH